MKLQDFLKANRMSQRDFAESIGVTQGLVYQWFSGRTSLTAERAIQIEAATKNAVTRYELRPDLWPPPPGFEPNLAPPSEDRRRTPRVAVSRETGEADGSTTRRTAPTAGSGEVIERAA